MEDELSSRRNRRSGNICHARSKQCLDLNTRHTSNTDQYIGLHRIDTWMLIRHRHAYFLGEVGLFSVSYTSVLSSLRESSVPIAGGIRLERCYGTTVTLPVGQTKADTPSLEIASGL